MMFCILFTRKKKKKKEINLVGRVLSDGWMDIT